jgi:hypothetical protein
VAVVVVAVVVRSSLIEVFKVSLGPPGVNGRAKTLADWDETEIS